MSPVAKTDAQDSNAARAEAEDQKNNRPQDSFYDISSEAAKRLGMSGENSQFAVGKDAAGDGG